MITDELRPAAQRHRLHRTSRLRLGAGRRPRRRDRGAPHRARAVGPPARQPPACTGPGCARRCGRPAGTAIDVIATGSGYRVHSGDRSVASQAADPGRAEPQPCATDPFPGRRPVTGYLTDGAEIYRQSFATIRAEADLSGLPADLARVAVRMIHACGMTDLVAGPRTTPPASSPRLGTPCWPAPRSCATPRWSPPGSPAAGCRPATRCCAP